MDNVTKKAVAPGPDAAKAAFTAPESTARNGAGPARAGRGTHTQTLLSNALAYVLLLIGAAMFLLPFLYMVSTAVKTVDQANEFPPRLIPTKATMVTVGGKEYPLARLKSGQQVAILDRSGATWTVEPTGPSAKPLQVSPDDVTPVEHFGMHLENFPAALTMLPFMRFFLNTLLIVVCTITGATLSAALCAYGFARLRFRGREPLFILLLATMMVPGQVTMIPVYILFKELHWINTYLPLIVPAWFGGGAFSIFLLRQFFQGIPFEMEEAARIDGCGPLTTWWRIMLPLSMPALATVAIFGFMAAWNDYMGPLIYINDTDKFTLALGLSLFKGQYGVDTPHLMMAATLVVLLPVLALFFFAQKHFIQGIVVSGVKG